MRTINTILLMGGLLVLIACNKDDGTAIQKSEAKQITSFIFKVADNENLNADIVAILDQAAGTITATMPTGTEISALTPQIEISLKATVNPSGVQDFSNQKNYTVTAEDGTSKTYSVIVSVIPSSEKQLLNLVLRAEDNSALNMDVETTIDSESGEVVGFVREGTQLNILLPRIEVSVGATIVPEGAQDFSAPVTYTVTAQDGSTVEYKVTLEELTDRRILIRLYNLNPDNTLNWDVTATDITTWDGIRTTAEGKVNYIFLSGKNIDSIPAELGFLDSLADLTLSQNKISTLPPQIGQLTNLKKFSFSGNDLKVLPPEIGQLNNLEFLSVSGTGLSELPSEIGQLSNLQELRATGNNLASLPPEFSNLQSLTELLLQGNNLGSVPLVIGDLINLEFLDLTNTAITSVPPEIAQLRNLKRISLSENELVVFPPAILELSNLESLGMYNTGISSLPNGLWQMDSLKSLNLGDNNVSQMPREIGLLENLTSLNWGGNDLGTAPRELWELTDLTYLDLQDNKLEAIPKDVEQLVKLTHLDLRDNELAFIPAELAELEELGYLYLSGNNIRILPGVICAMDRANGGTTEIDIVPSSVCLSFVDD